MGVAGRGRVEDQGVIDCEMTNGVQSIAVADDVLGVEDLKVG